MAPKNVNYVGPTGLSEYEQIKINEHHRMQDEPIYCKFCGSPILKTLAPEAPWELENHAHASCARDYQTRKEAEIAARIEAQKKIKEQ